MIPTSAFVGFSAALAMLGVAAAVHGQPVVLYVDDDAPAGGSGATWQDAFRDLQDALAVVNSAPGSYEVRIAEGVYTPDRSAGDQTTSFYAGTVDIASAVTLSLAMLGGFAGIDRADPDERDPARYPTVLSGDLLGNDSGGDSSRDDNSNCVVRIWGFVGDVVLDGLVVRGGNGRAHTSTLAAGIVVYSSDDQSSATLNDCIVADNHSSDYYTTGGAVVGARDVAIGRSVFRGNSGSNTEFGLLYYTGIGGLRVTGPGGYPPGVALVTDCLVEGNTGARCGGLAGSRNLEVRRTRIIDNSSATHAGGLWAQPYHDLRLENCLVAGNTAVSFGGGLLVDSGELDLVNCTVVGNRAEYGGGVLADGYWTRVRNSILWDNQATAGGSALAIDCRDGQVSVRSSLVQGGASGLYGFWENLEWEGTLDTDPLFLDPSSDRPDYHLMQASPCVDGGDSATAFAEPFDLDVLPRFVGSRADIGCYELQTPDCPADFNGDGFTDGLDIDGFNNAFTAGDIRADVNRDGFVDGIDYDDFFRSFEAGC